MARNTQSRQPRVRSDIPTPLNTSGGTEDRLTVGIGKVILMLESRTRRRGYRLGDTLLRLENGDDIQGAPAGDHWAGAKRHHSLPTDKATKSFSSYSQLTGAPLTQQGQA